MRPRAWAGPIVAALLSALAVLAAGCLPAPSLYPYVEEGDAIALPEVVGEWADSSSTIRIELERGTAYTLSDPDSGASPSRFKARFFRLDGRLFADVSAAPGSFAGGDPKPWAWPMHTAFRVDLSGDSLRMAFLDDDWLKEALERHRLKARHELPAGELVLTEPTKGLQAMLRKAAKADAGAAFDTSATWMRRR